MPKTNYDYTQAICEVIAKPNKSAEEILRSKEFIGQIIVEYEESRKANAHLDKIVNGKAQWFGSSLSSTRLGDCTPLMVAAKEGKYELAQFLIENYAAKVSGSGGRFGIWDIWDALDCALTWGKNEELNRYLAKKYIEQEYSSNSAYSASSGKILDLTTEKIADDRLRRLARALALDTNMVKLMLPKNLLANIFKHFAIALENNTSLRILVMDSNSLATHASIPYLISLLKKNSGLVKISLLGCELSRSDLINLSHGFIKKQHPSLRMLKFNRENLFYIKLSETEKSLLPNKSVDESVYLTSNDFLNIPNILYLVNLIKQKIPFYSFEEIRDFTEEHISVESMSVKEKKIQLVSDIIHWLDKYMSAMEQDESADTKENVLVCLNHFITFLANSYQALELTSWPEEERVPWETLHYSLTLASDTALSNWMENYHSSLPKPNLNPKELALKIFRRTFKSYFERLYSAAKVVSSGKVECAEKTATEEVISAAKHLILMVPYVVGTAEALLHLGHAAGKVAGSLTLIEEVMHSFKIPEHISEGIPQIEHKIGSIKETISRYFHGLTPRDKLQNLVNLFVTDDNFSKKIKSLAQQISGTYEEEISEFSPARAAIEAKAAAVHLTDLLMSGRVSVEDLSQEAVMWLAYVPSRNHRPKLKDKNDRDVVIGEGFYHSRIKFSDNLGVVHYCNITSKDESGRVPVRDDSKYKSRWATLKEIDALYKLQANFQANIQQQVLITQHRSTTLFFNEETHRELSGKQIPWSTKVLSHITPRKRIAKLEKEVEMVEISFKNRLIVLEEKLQSTISILEASNKRVIKVIEENILLQNENSKLTDIISGFKAVLDDFNERLNNVERCVRDANANPEIVDNVNEKSISSITNVGLYSERSSGEKNNFSSHIHKRTLSY